MSKSRFSEKLELVGIKLINYRSYCKFPNDDSYLNIKKFTTFIGKNDAGKSNILKAIYIVCENKPISYEDLHKGNKNDCEISLFFKVPDELKEIISKEFKVNLDENRIIEIKKAFEWDGDKNKLKNGQYILNDKDIKYKDIKNYLPHVLYIPAVKNVEDELKFGKDTLVSRLFLPIIEKTSEEKGQGESVSMLKYKLRNTIQNETQEIRGLLKNELSKMWADVEEITIDIPELKLEKAFNPVIKIKDRYMGKELSITYRGSGIQRYLILSLLEIYRKKKIGKGCLLLFEEPEVYLHIGAQKKMCGILKEFSKEGSVIISTHSNVFVNKSDIFATYLLVKENGETIVRKFEGDEGDGEILEELGISPSDIFLTNGIILVEGPSDVEILKIFADAIFENWDEYNISIIPVGGSNINHYDPSTLLRVNPNIIVILDSDIESESHNLLDKKEDLKRKFEDAGIKVYFWKKDGKYVRELENLFVKEAIEKALNITLDSEIKLYSNVPEILRKKLYENQDIRYNKYHKIIDGKKIAKEMVCMGEIPSIIQEILNSIINDYCKEHNY